MHVNIIKHTYFKMKRKYAIRQKWLLLKKENLWICKNLKFFSFSKVLKTS